MYNVICKIVCLELTEFSSMEENYYIEGVTPIPIPGQTVNGYVLGETLHRLVYLTNDPRTGFKYAIKFIPRTVTNLQQIESEINIMQQLNHPHITKLVDDFIVPGYHVILTKYAPCRTLLEFTINRYQSGEGISETLAKKIFAQAASAIHYCHQCRIWHCDIKLENFLVVNNDPNNFFLELTDFGYALQMQPNELGQIYRGTEHYCSPEICRNTPYTKKVDIWSLGVTLYSLISGRMPFSTENSVLRRHHILAGIVRFKSSRFNYVSSECKTLILNMLQVDPECRFSAEQCLFDPWVGLTRKQLSDIESEIYSACGRATSEGVFYHDQETGPGV